MNFGGNGTWIEWNNVAAPRASVSTLSVRYSHGGTAGRGATSFAIAVRYDSKTRLDQRAESVFLASLVSVQIQASPRGTLLGPTCNRYDRRGYLRQSLGLRTSCP